MIQWGLENIGKFVERGVSWVRKVDARWWIFLAVVVTIGLNAPTVRQYIQASYESGGTIIVDTPEVYTRERLVNDRFMQDYWLRERLNELDDEIKNSSNLSGSIDRSDRFKLQVGSSKSDSSATDEREISSTSMGRQNVGQSSPTSQVGLTLLQRFHDHLDYRDQIRHELLENQLDDRHDIYGNTLILLKFDATILPENSADGWGAVVAKLEPADREFSIDSIKNWNDKFVSVAAQRTADAGDARKSSGDESDASVSNSNSGDATRSLSQCSSARSPDSLDPFPDPSVKDSWIAPYCATYGEEWATSDCIEVYSDIYAEWLEVIEKSLEESVRLTVVGFERRVGENVRVMRALYERGISRLADRKPDASSIGKFEESSNCADDECKSKRLEESEKESLEVEELAKCMDSGCRRDWWQKRVNEQVVEETWKHKKPCLEAIALNHEETSCRNALRMDLSRARQDFVSETARCYERSAGNADRDDRRQPSPWQGECKALRKGIMEQYEQDRTAAQSAFEKCAPKEDSNRKGQTVRMSTDSESNRSLLRIAIDSLSNPKTRESALQDAIDEMSLPERNSFERCSPIQLSYERLGAVAQLITESRPLPGDNQVTESIKECVDVRSLEGKTSEYVIEQLVAEQQCSEAGMPTALGAYACFALRGCDAGKCRIEVTSKVKDPRRRVDPRVPADLGNSFVVERAIPPPFEFVRALKNSEFAYAYAVTPKHSVDRTRQQYEQSEELAAMPPVGSGGDDLIDVRVAQSKRSTGFPEQPLVLGFGHGAAARMFPFRTGDIPLIDMVSRSLSTLFSRREPDPTPPGIMDRETVFGWLLGPRAAPGVRNLDSRHQARQAALSAIVSVPSWWKRARVSIKTCWDVEPESPIERCAADSAGYYQYMIALPGDPKGVSRAFNFIVPREPRVYTAEDTEKRILTVGKRGSILIRGPRLWRSTVVTLGSQVADMIRVMPDMEAIVAEFKCVGSPLVISHIPGQGPASEGQSKTALVPVTVWTSQGRAEADKVEVEVSGSLQCPEEVSGISGPEGNGRTYTSQGRPMGPPGKASEDLWLDELIKERVYKFELMDAIRESVSKSNATQQPPGSPARPGPRPGPPRDGNSLPPAG
jgi:hypothetical protein